MIRASAAALIFAAGAYGQAADARAAFGRGDYAAAVRLFSEAQALKPECPNLFYIGVAQYRLGKAQEAIISFQAAVECDASMTPAHIALGEAYSERGNDGEAIAAYTKALAVEPRNVAALRAAVALYLKNDLQAQATPLLERLVALDDRDAEAHVDLAAVHAAAGNRAAAEKEYRRALELRPSSPSALTGLGNLLLRAGETADALPLLSRAAALLPTAYAPRFLLGSAYNRSGEFEKAVEELQAALRLGGGTDPQVYYHLARAMGGLGKADERKEALTKFSELTRKEKESADAQRRAARYVDEARTLMQAGNLHGAIQRLDDAREARPGDASLLFRLAGLHFDLGQLDQAREHVQAAISISPSTWLHHFLSGLIEQRAGRWSDAQSSLETAARLNGSAAEVHNALGEVAMRQSDAARAIASFQRAVELNPREPAYRLNLEAARKAAN